MMSQLRRGEAFTRVRLYVLITEAACRRPWLEAAAEAIAGGADCLQLREKAMDGGELLARARMLVALCRKHDVLCIINDRPDIAILSDADGVHVGQEDLPAREVRHLIGDDRLVGVSTHAMAQARAALADGADYIGVGPVFYSATKPRDILPGLAYATQAAKEMTIPTVAIGGINARNIDEVAASGVSAAAVTASVANADDPRAAAMELKKRMQRIG